MLEVNEQLQFHSLLNSVDNDFQMWLSTIFVNNTRIS